MVPKISLDVNYITFGDTRKKEQIFLYTDDSLIYDLKTGRCFFFSKLELQLVDFD